jgi:hypothetical protein|uniref:Uncharacterized protein n=1 Tax=Myoviridae sp. ctPuP5 TaxID=2823543 RepID=A0A8S5LA12_9CAUD|nr:MAG TPA: hypothetical protein [Myoviridae sp. ctPuP5]
MEKLLFNTVSKQAKELQKTAENALYAFVNNQPNKMYQTAVINDEDVILTFDNEMYAFVGCFIDKTKNTLSSALNKGLKLLGYKIETGTINTISYKELFEIELYNIDNIQLLSVVQYINQREFSDD